MPVKSIGTYPCIPKIFESHTKVLPNDTVYILESNSLWYVNDIINSMVSQ